MSVISLWSMSEIGHPCTIPSLPKSVNLFVSLYLKWVSHRQHLAGSWLFFFLFNLASFCLLIELFWPIIFCLIIDMLGFKSNIMIFFYQSPFIWYCAISGCFHFCPSGFCTVLSYHVCFKPIIHCYHFCFKQLIILKRNLDNRKGLYIYAHSYHFWCSSFLCKVRFPCGIIQFLLEGLLFTFLPMKNLLLAFLYLKRSSFCRPSWVITR